MEKPANNNEIRLVAILRTLNITQEDVKTLLKIGKTKVVNIENWLRTAEIDDVAGLFSEDTLKQVVDTIIAEFEDINPGDIARAARLTPGDILENYRRDYSQRTGNRSGIPGGATTVFYREHQRKLLERVKELKNNLRPDLHSTYVRQVKDSTGGKGDIQIDFELNLDRSTAADVVRNYFEQHLNSGGYEWLFGSRERGIKKWVRVANEELYLRVIFLTAIDRRVETTIGETMRSRNSLGLVGPLQWFSETIFDSLLEGLYHGLEYSVSPAENGLFAVKFGAFSIGLTSTEKEALGYIDQHRGLMARFQKSDRVHRINEIRRSRTVVEREITGVLSKFEADNHVPGRCDYQFCG